MTNKNNKLCALPWNHLYVTNTGTIFPCCASHYTLGQADKDGWVQHIEDEQIVSTISDTQNMKGLREALLKGEEPDVCKGCFDKEKEGIWSYRQTANLLFEETHKELLEKKLDLNSPMKLEFLDLRLGNRCNLACRMCNASSSHLLLDDFREYLNDESFGKELEGMDWFSNRLMYKNLVENSENLKIINMAGGEPFIIDETWEFLEMLIEKGISKNIELRYNTNLTVIPEKAKRLWPHFKGVVLFLSIDGIEDIYEYIRFPAKWSKINTNLLRLDKEFDDFNITSAKIQMTVQAYNVSNIPEITRYLQSFNKIDRVPIINLLDHPDELSIKSLPIAHRKEVAKKLKLFLMEIFELEGLKKLVTFEDFLRNLTFITESLLDDSSFEDSRYEEFKKLTSFFDKKRNQSLAKVLPGAV